MEKKNEKGLQFLLAILFWVAVWQVGSMAVRQVLLLPSPIDTLRALASLVFTSVFWGSVFNSLWHIALGFFMGLLLGIILGVVAAWQNAVAVLLRPLMQLMLAVPVASYVVLLLIWGGSAWLSTYIGLLLVLPVIYNNMLVGIGQVNGQLLEMARLFHIPFWRRVRAIYLPALRPSLLSAMQLSIGLSWKSGVAAEVMGVTTGTIGYRLYQAKIYLQMPEMFAWTVMIVLVSWLFAKITIAVTRRLLAWIERGWGRWQA